MAVMNTHHAANTFEFRHVEKIFFADLYMTVCEFQMCVETKMTKALLLALGVCYQASLKSRDEYRQFITNYFLPPLDLSDGATEMEHEITKYVSVSISMVSWSRSLKTVSIHLTMFF